MSRKYADYVYATPDDDIRVRVFRKCGGNWDFDVYCKTSKETTNYSFLAGDDFSTKAEALKEAKTIYRGLKSIVTKDSWTK